MKKILLSLMAVVLTVSLPTSVVGDVLTIEGEEEGEEIVFEKMDVSNDKTKQIVNTEQPKKVVISHDPIDQEKKQALVIPHSTNIFRGWQYVADIVMLNADPSCDYTIFVNGKIVEGNRLRFSVAHLGRCTFEGYILETNKKGKSVKYPFAGEYYGMEPHIDVLNEMDVLFAGVVNKLNISVPGEASSNISVDITNATFGNIGSHFDVTPTTPHSLCQVSVFVKIDEKQVCMGTKRFRVLPLPRPDASLRLESGNMFNGGKIGKEDLVNVKDVATMLTDWSDLSKMLDVKNLYTILNFDMKFFNPKSGVEVLHSESNEITGKMREKINSLSSGAQFYVTNVKVKSLDGNTHVLPPLEVIVK